MHTVASRVDNDSRRRDRFITDRANINLVGLLCLNVHVVAGRLGRARRVRQRVLKRPPTPRLLTLLSHAVFVRGIRASTLRIPVELRLVILGVRRIVVVAAMAMTIRGPLARRTTTRRRMTSVCVTNIILDVTSEPAPFTGRGYSAERMHSDDRVPHDDSLRRRHSRSSTRPPGSLPLAQQTRRWNQAALSVQGNGFGEHGRAECGSSRSFARIPALTVERNQ
jgi:hypothetical protein